MPKRTDIDRMDVWKQLGQSTEEKPVSLYRDAKLIGIDLIKPDPDQPRKTFDEASLDELAASIEEKGIMQPLVVRPEGDEFIIIAGHRRLRACKRVGIQYIPCIVRDISRREAREQALVENIQRDDLPPIEEAQCYRQLMDEYEYSVRDMAKKVGKSVGYIHSRLGLLRYPDIAQSVQEDQIGIYQARELAKVEDEETRRDLTNKVAKEELDRDALKQAVGVAARQTESEPEPPQQEKEPAVEREGERLQGEAPEPAGAVSASAEVSFEETQQKEMDVAPPSEGPSEVSESESGGAVPASFNQEVLHRQWQALEQNLETLNLDSLAEREREEMRRLLEAMRDTIDRLLG